MSDEITVLERDEVYILQVEAYELLSQEDKIVSDEFQMSE